MPWVWLGSMRLSALTVRLLGRAHHERDVGSIDVGVYEADALAEARKRDGQVDSNGGFAHPALAGTNGDDFRDAGQSNGGRHGLGMRHSVWLLLEVRLSCGCKLVTVRSGSF